RLRSGGWRTMKSSVGWLLGGIVLILVGIMVGVLITATSNFAPVSVAQEIGGGAEEVVGLAAREFGESPFVAVAGEIMPAVVSVDTKRTIRRSGDPFEEMWRQFFGESPRSPQRQPEYEEYEVPGSASGFIFDREGYILTNNHVVRGADEIEVTLSDGREYSAEVVGQDPSTDIAVIRIQGDDLPFVRFGDSSEIKVGSWAIAIGNPLSLKGTVTVGVVSALGRANLNIAGGAPVYQDFIQTDASINFGNSGGPLCNIQGEVIGINSATNVSAEGIGFAIPSNLAREVAEALMADGRVVRGYLGVVPQDITRDLAEATGLESTKGVLIASVEGDTPAADAGLEAGDVVIEIDGEKIDDTVHFRRVVAGVEPGEKARMKVLRDGDMTTVTAKLVERPTTEEESGEEPLIEEEIWLGLEVSSLDDPLAEELDIQARSGVLVIGVERRSEAADAGIIPGDVVVRIGDEQVANLSDYRDAVQRYREHDKAVAIMVQRGAHTYFVAVRPGG
ncbi:Do family serine endopeptidase, partial [bacterium]|nr:Do family serine endopeptidase [bacterium]